MTARTSGAQPPPDARLLAMAHSPDVADRLRACAGLAGVDAAWAVAALRELLYDAHDLAPMREAARALLERGDQGWDWVLEAVWRSGGPAEAHTLAAPITDRLSDGRDAEARLQERATRSASPAARRGAMEVQMILGIRPMEYIRDEDEQ